VIADFTSRLEFDLFFEEVGVGKRAPRAAGRMVRERILSGNNGAFDSLLQASCYGDFAVMSLQVSEADANAPRRLLSSGIER